MWIALWCLDLRKHYLSLFLLLVKSIFEPFLPGPVRNLILVIIGVLLKHTTHTYTHTHTVFLPPRTGTDRPGPELSSWSLWLLLFAKAEMALHCWDRGALRSAHPQSLSLQPGSMVPAKGSMLWSQPVATPVCGLWTPYSVVCYLWALPLSAMGLRAAGSPILPLPPPLPTHSPGLNSRDQPTASPVCLSGSQYLNSRRTFLGLFLLEALNGLEPQKPVYFSCT